MCRVFFGHVDPDPRIVEIGRRVVEFSEFLVECMGVTDVGARFPHTVTLHNGCHTRRELGVTDPPLKLLENVRDMTYVELTNWEECCGFGGTFSVKMPGTSLAMGHTKTEHIVRTGADVVVSLDISCLMHMGGILRRNPQTRHIRTMHLAELLDAGNMTATAFARIGRRRSSSSRKPPACPSPTGSKSLGIAAERSSKHNRELAADDSLLARVAGSGPSDQGPRHRQSRQAAGAVRGATSAPAAARCCMPKTPPKPISTCWTSSASTT